MQHHPTVDGTKHPRKPCDWLKDQMRMQMLKLKVNKLCQLTHIFSCLSRWDKMCEFFCGYRRRTSAKNQIGEKRTKEHTEYT